MVTFFLLIGMSVYTIDGDSDAFHLYCKNKKVSPPTNNIFRTVIYGLKFLWDEQSFLYRWLIMLQSGDIELNSGPLNIYKEVTQKSNNECNLKFFHVNCQSIVHKKGQPEVMMQDLGINTVYGISETWLKSDNGATFWETTHLKKTTSKLSDPIEKWSVGIKVVE